MGIPMERLNKLEAWQLNGIGLVACAGLAGLWYTAGYSPLSQAKAARQNLQLDLDAKRDTVAHLTKMRLAHEQSLERIKQDAKKNSTELKPVEELLDRISALSKAAATAGLTLDEIKPGATVVRERFAVLPIHLAGTGSFPGCAAFLHELRSRYPDTGVTGMDLRGEPEQSEKPARFVIDLNWYAARPEAPSKAPAQTDPTTQK